MYAHVNSLILQSVKTLAAGNKTVIISKTSSVRYPENLYMSRYILQDFMMEKKKKLSTETVKKVEI
jgi:hypothetical protein